MIERILKLTLVVTLTLSQSLGVLAQTCTATMTDMNFGNVEVALNPDVGTTGDLLISCSGANPNQ